MKAKSIIIIFLSLMLTSCKTSSVEGLWIVKSVQVGDEIMTPNARWTRLNKDNTQESGNGWFQHSYGTWTLDQEAMTLNIKNTNGIDDPNGPFSVSVSSNEMTWERVEDGQNIKVTLERSSKFPETHGDKLLGLWELEKAIGKGKYFEASNETESLDYIFFRWDKRFVIESKKRRINGVYNVHGHKPEVELIPYGENLNRDFWTIDFEENQITLKLLNSDEKVTRKFKRIHQFP
jgi:hypothetical protein